MTPANDNQAVAHELDAAALAHLAPAIEPELLPWLAGEVRDLRAVLVPCVRDGERVGSVVLRLDGDELVIVAAGGSGGGLCKEFLPVVEAAARRSGVSRLRAHTRRPGMRRTLERLGFRETERVYGKELV
ncbi:MAG TPA: hypothetical protein VGN75_03765 [Kaistia sp.]|nr:hypothetical protein [Kaistia sp.]